MGPLRLSALVLLAGCDGVLGLIDIKPPPDAVPDSTIDASPDAPPCVSPAIVDPFNPGPACTGWGNSFSIGGSVSADGALELTLGANALSYSGCQSNNPTPFGVDGVFAEVASTPIAAHEITLLTIYWPDTTYTSIAQQNGMLSVLRVQTRLTTQPFDATAMRWWRLRPVDATHVAAEYSKEGMFWHPLGGDVVTDSSMGKIEVRFKNDQAEPSPNAAAIAGLNTCP
jgi:hypothetical protein